MPRGFPPQRIRNWSDTAHQLAYSDSTVDIGFVVAYSAWEALQGRILAVALFRQGYAMSVAHEFLGSNDLNDRRMVKAQFEVILGRPPSQTPVLGQHWRALEVWSHHRNGLVHGLSTYAPDTLRAGVAEIGQRLQDTTWLHRVRVPRELGGDLKDFVLLGDVMAAQRGGRRNGKDAAALARAVRAIRSR